MSKFKILVEMVIDYGDNPEEVIQSPIFGVNAIAQQYADMAIKYNSISAESSTVVSITEIK